MILVITNQSVDGNSGCQRSAEEMALMIFNKYQSHCTSKVTDGFLICTVSTVFSLKLCDLVCMSLRKLREVWNCLKSLIHLKTQMEGLLFPTVQWPEQRCPGSTGICVKLLTTSSQTQWGTPLQRVRRTVLSDLSWGLLHSLASKDGFSTDKVEQFRGFLVILV